MRPGTGLENISPRSRHSSAGEGARPTTFFLTRDPDVHVPPQTQPLNESIEQDVAFPKSYKETPEEIGRTSRQSPSKRRQSNGRDSRRRSTIKPAIVADVKSPVLMQQNPNSPIMTGALTPSMLPSRDTSLPSSPKSMSSRSIQKSEEGSTLDDTESQAIASSDDDQDEEMLPEVEDSSPQLIMPSIKMPSRRPFTPRGKQLGRLKILVAGTKGCGRTSLIKSIVQLCEDIVHVDPLVAAPGQRTGSGSQEYSVNEIHASTKPYPAWWSEVDESRILKRRKSMGDSVLERNICFVDTTDSGKTDKVISYIEQQFLRTIDGVSQPTTEFAGLLAGRGGSQVDVVLYLMTRDTVKIDVERIQRMSQLCNVVPLICKADQLSAGQISDMKATPGLTSITLPCLPPPFVGNAQESAIQATAPYSVSSANGPDFDNMDASLLMAPEYVQPLLPSELAILVEQLFDLDTVAYLKHTSAKKLVTWYASEPRLTQTPSPSLHSAPASTLNSPLQTSISHSGVLVPATSELSLNTSNSYALAKIADHAQREEHLAQIRLSKWATDLQLSLQRERERYESIARSERALWLVQRMGEEIREGQVVPANRAQTMLTTADKNRLMYSDVYRHEVHDPLGLLRWRNTARTRGWIALQVMGSFGVIGGVALWLARTWGLTTSLHDWAQQWTENWFS